MTNNADKADRANKKSLEKAEELSEFELQNVQGGLKGTGSRLEAKESAAKKPSAVDREEAAKKQVTSDKTLDKDF